MTKNMFLIKEITKMKTIEKIIIIRIKKNISKRRREKRGN
jgi:hypothetical protein